jgi:hypothetical protein
MLPLLSTPQYPAFQPIRFILRSVFSAARFCSAKFFDPNFMTMPMSKKVHGIFLPSELETNQLF